MSFVEKMNKRTLISKRGRKEKVEEVWQQSLVAYTPLLFRLR